MEQKIHTNRSATGRGIGWFRDIKDLPEICCRPRLHPQSFQSGTSSLQSRGLQTQSLRPFNRVASTCSLRDLDCWLYCSDQVNLTMPLGFQIRPIDRELRRHLTAYPCLEVRLINAIGLRRGGNTERNKEGVSRWLPRFESTVRWPCECQRVSSARCSRRDDISS